MRYAGEGAAATKKPARRVPGGLGCERGGAVRCAYLGAALVRSSPSVANRTLIFVVRLPKIAMSATAIIAAIRPYSIAVAPDEILSRSDGKTFNIRRSALTYG